ncbi:MAG: SCP2 sterol-binding domain-containing protein [Geodermatophilaceae bacterium]|nr:SCP2 sterol-binding domain-containing protein [Geodermatophilaceae bacterium]MDQ3466380.1 SCP2 sterol-binding domain-containing protein [Actinomycetota bacterium]
MATQQECEQALQELSAIIARSGGSENRPLRRSVSCRITDLDVAFAGELRQGRLEDIVQTDPTNRAKADIQLTTTSDDLIRLVDGSLGFAAAWSSGRLRVDASFMDLLKLQKML